MAADYQAIIDAIDTAIADWVGQPVTMTAASGKSQTYRSLTELIAARREYVALLKSQQGSSGFHISALTSRGAI